MKKQFTIGRASVDILSDADKRDAINFQSVDDRDQIPKAASEPVEFIDDERVALASEFDRRFQSGARL